MKQPKVVPLADQPATLSRIFERHNDDLVAFLSQRLDGNVAEAQDVAQEAYARILRLDRSKSISFLRAYLYRTAANLALDRQRQAVRRPQFSEAAEADLPQDERTPERIASARQELEALETAVAELPPRYRRAFQLHRVAGRSADEVGLELGVQAPQVRVYLRRALSYCLLRRDGVRPAQARRRSGL